jgi:hypothetical protein
MFRNAFVLAWSAAPRARPSSPVIWTGARLALLLSPK